MKSRNGALAARGSSGHFLCDIILRSFIYCDCQMKMTNKQAKFCDEYLLDLNATQAAIRSGYSARTAAQIGYENLRKPDVRARVAQLQRAAAERNQISLDELIADLRRLRDEAFANGSYGAVKGALDLMGRTIGAYTNKVETKTDLRMNNQFVDPNDVLGSIERLARIAGLRGR